MVRCEDRACSKLAKLGQGLCLLVGLGVRMGIRSQGRPFPPMREEGEAGHSAVHLALVVLQAGVLFQKPLRVQDVLALRWEHGEAAEEPKSHPRDKFDTGPSKLVHCADAIYQPVREYVPVRILFPEFFHALGREAGLAQYLLVGQELLHVLADVIRVLDQVVVKGVVKRLSGDDDAVLLLHQCTLTPAQKADGVRSHLWLFFAASRPHRCGGFSLRTGLLRR
mmetsp:Transcript_69818/g.215907  ORF Transcript_69818/g.215907 Transcript_69818/m.215907 type:complete len:223 (+) Transcript_69818:796-1464(+)